jgi:hypothetical protein
MLECMKQTNNFMKSRKLALKGRARRNQKALTVCCNQTSYPQHVRIFRSLLKSAARVPTTSLPFRLRWFLNGCGFAWR